VFACNKNKALQLQHVPILSILGCNIDLGLYFEQALQFPNLRRKGGKFDHRPERPKVLLRTPLPLTPLVWLHHCRAHCTSTSTTCWRRSSARPSAVVSCRPPSSTCSTSSTTWHCTTPSSTHTSRTRGNPTGPGSAPLYDTISAGLMPTEARGNYLPEAPYLRETKTYPNCI